MLGRLFTKTAVTAVVLSAALLGTDRVAQAVQITGAGSTFVYPIMLKWMQLYQKSHPDIKIDYEAIGSGAGISNLTNRTVNFCGSDAYMTNSQIAACGGHVLHLPEAAGPEVMSYNLPGVNQQLVFNGRLIADIYLGRVTQWNDPAIQKLNPGVKLPDLPILVAHRSDGSGTTFIFTGYLCKVSPDWAQQVGQATSVNWPVGRGGKGNPGVAALIEKTRGGLGYLEYAYAIQGHFSDGRKIPVAKLINKDGNAVAPSIPAVIAAQKAIVENLPADLRLPIIDPSGKDAYPISGFTYLIINQDLGYMSKEKALATVQFIHWILTQGQDYCKDLEYIRLGPAMQKQVLAELSKVRWNGQKLLKD